MDNGEGLCMLKSDEVARRLCISRTTAYGVINELNAELEAKGLKTRPGRVSKDYFEKRYFGGRDGVQ